MTFQQDAISLGLPFGHTFRLNDTYGFGGHSLFVKNHIYAKGLIAINDSGGIFNGKSVTQTGGGVVINPALNNVVQFKSANVNFVHWELSENSVNTIDSNGLFTLKKLGFETINAIDDYDKKYSLTLNFVVPIMLLIKETTTEDVIFNRSNNYIFLASHPLTCIGSRFYIITSVSDPLADFPSSTDFDASLLLSFNATGQTNNRKRSYSFKINTTFPSPITTGNYTITEERKSELLSWFDIPLNVVTLDGVGGNKNVDDTEIFNLEGDWWFNHANELVLTYDTSLLEVTLVGTYPSVTGLNIKYLATGNPTLRISTLGMPLTDIEFTFNVS